MLKTQLKRLNKWVITRKLTSDSNKTMLSSHVFQTKFLSHNSGKVSFDDCWGFVLIC